MSEITMMREKVELSHYKLLRRRYVPMEEVDISGDKVIYRDDSMLVTSWTPIRPRDDIKAGVSYWFLDRGWKISKIYNQDGSFKHYYCDIVRYETDPTSNVYIVIDLLLDLTITEDGNYRVLDFAEFVEEYEKKTISDEEYSLAIKNLSELIEAVNNGEFPLKELSMY